MPGDDLKEHAQSSVDFYDLLGVNFETNEADIRRAYRRTALKYHPDKNVGNADAVEKFHILQIAYDVLSDPTYKAIYDNTRRAKKDQDDRHQAFEGKRRQMKEDLERRESKGFKRKRDEDDHQDKLQREIQRLAEDGKRRRLARQEMLKRERLEEEERLDRERDGYTAHPTTTPPGGTHVPDIDRSIKVTWSRQGKGESIDKDRLKSLFSAFGAIDSVILLKDKKKKLSDSKTKTLMATAVIVYSSVVGTHAAIEDYKKQLDPDFQLFESVFWASNKEPDFLRPKSAAATTPAAPPPQPSTSTSTPDLPRPSTPLPIKKTAGDGLRKVPSFASFSPMTSPATAAGNSATSSPSLLELTKIRLKMAEKRRLEQQIRDQDAEAEGKSTPSE